MPEIKYDIKRGADIYRAIYSTRLKNWISKSVIKRGEALVWRSGLSGWRKPEELEELSPLFEQWEKEQRSKEGRWEKQTLLEEEKKEKKKIKKILIIEDEKDLCKLFSYILSPKGYTVASANTRKDGLVYIRKEKPDLVFLDLKLPDGDGMELLPKIKKMLPKTAVIIISAYGSEESREAAKRKPVCSFIDKPFGEENILRCISTIS